MSGSSVTVRAGARPLPLAFCTVWSRGTPAVSGRAPPSAPSGVWASAAPPSHVLVAVRASASPSSLVCRVSVPSVRRAIFAVVPSVAPAPGPPASLRIPGLVFVRAPRSMFLIPGTPAPLVLPVTVAPPFSTAFPASLSALLSAFLGLL